MHEKGFYFTAMGHFAESSTVVVVVVVIVVMTLYSVSTRSSLSSCKHDIFGVQYKNGSPSWLNERVCHKFHLVQAIFVLRRASMEKSIKA